MTRISRRQFIEDSVLAAAVAAAFPAADAFAAPKKNKKASADKKSGDLLQVAIVGVGGRGGDHIKEYLNNPYSEIAYVVDADIAHAQRAATTVGGRQGKTPKAVQDLRKALDDKSVHIVSIATPNHWHALCAIWAMQAGKDVYVEKPVSHNVSEGRRIVEGYPQARSHRVRQARNADP